VTVGEYIDRYLARYEREHKASSYTEARCQLTRFKREFADRVIGSIARHQAIEWADDKPGSLVKPVVTMLQCRRGRGATRPEPVPGTRQTGEGPLRRASAHA
jgi:hypothetical protein